MQKTKMQLPRLIALGFLALGFLALGFLTLGALSTGNTITSVTRTREVVMEINIPYNKTIEMYRNQDAAKGEEEEQDVEICYVVLIQTT
ncbi:hypothetical protein MKZ38_002567 [Zalerion maritima]|uniref:Uncharacterized protein n=1 Tax=Zalerion maritima TaxID=339359 RepID=A0AAD5RNQ3_9PEZI|nr:hypothetical protein MKZ38_002567 [Zalerion maritima]